MKKLDEILLKLYKQANAMTIYDETISKHNISQIQSKIQAWAQSKVPKKRRVSNKHYFSSQGFNNAIDQMNKNLKEK